MVWASPEPTSERILHLGKEKVCDGAHRAFVMKKALGSKARAFVADGRDFAHRGVRDAFPQPRLRLVGARGCGGARLHCTVKASSKLYVCPPGFVTVTRTGPADTVG